MNTTDHKKRILHLIERYASARCYEELAGNRDAMAAVERHHSAGKKAWDEVGEEIGKLLADLAYWTEGTRLIEECLAKAKRADSGDVPFPLVGDEARLWHAAQATAYQHALEMMGRPAAETKP